jgi:hypothetical protein
LRERHGLLGALRRRAPSRVAIVYRKVRNPMNACPLLARDVDRPGMNKGGDGDEREQDAKNPMVDADGERGIGCRRVDRRPRDSGVGDLGGQEPRYVQGQETLREQGGVSGNRRRRHCVLVDVNVSLFAIDFRGDGTQDLDVLLVGPGGSALILSDVGGFTTTSNITVTLDDQQQEPLPSNTALTFGFFQPTNFGSPDTMNLGNGPVTVESGDSLGVFNGVNPNGEWRLFVFDDSPGNDVPVPGSGIIGGWALEITTDNGVPRSAADTFQAQAGKTLNVPAPGVLANDSDPDGDVLTAQLINEPRKGTVLLRPDGSFTYRAKKKARGTDFFGYLVRDPSGLTGLEGVSIQIKGKGKKKKGRR